MDQGGALRLQADANAGPGHPGSGEAEKNCWENLPLLTPHDEVKFVIADRRDYEYARDIVQRLIKVSDVVLNNFAPGVMDRWGLTYEAMRAINPRIIAVSMPAMGATGPRRHFRGLGSYFQAMAGLDVMIGYPHREVVDMGFAFPDATCNPAHATVAILAALRHRNRTGEGQWVDMACVEAGTTFTGPDLLDYTVTVTNDGSVTLYRKSINDSIAGNLLGTPNAGISNVVNNCGASFTDNIETSITSVAAEKAEVPPEVPGLTLLPAVPVVWSQARRVNAEEMFWL